MVRFAIILLFWAATSLQLIGQSYVQSAMEQFKSNSSSSGLLQNDVKELEVSSFHQYDGRYYVYLQQQYAGKIVENAVASVVLGPDYQVLSSMHHLIDSISQRAVVQSFEISSLDAIKLCAKELNQNIGQSIKKVPAIRGDLYPHREYFEVAELSKQPILVQSLWILQEEKLIEVKKIEVNQLTDGHVWEFYISAEGDLLKKDDQVLSCQFHDHENEPSVSSFKPSPTKKEYRPRSEQKVRSYNVYPLYVENPSFGDRVLIEAPSDPIASPFGWHDVDGQEGAEHTDTRGNNVYAQEDYNTDDFGGLRANGGQNLFFDFSVEFDAGPRSYINASLTNLFFWSNLNHDIFYHYGFDEASGNFQKNNYGQGGKDNDQVYADAQDGSGQNNAFFYSPPDGQHGRMELFIWSDRQASIKLNTGGGEIKFIGIESAFDNGRNLLFNLGDQSAEIVQVIDQNGESAQGCRANPIANKLELKGNIALVDRGDCLFTEKTLNAQQAGALACIICNNESGAPFAMVGNSPNISIPAIMLSRKDCNTLKDILLKQDKVEAVMSGGAPGNYLDAAFDNLIITHEYGHGISSRLTGGKDLNRCLSNEEQMGEGWSDYFGLMLTTDWSSATPTDPRTIASWLLKEEESARKGIRPYPYSYDLAVNPMKYNDIKRLPAPHGVGAVWCSMLWDMTWEIISEVSADPDIYLGNGGNNIALRLVVEGLKLQACNPGFVDGRDAILKADELLYEGRYAYAIWKAFARRGLGAKADQKTTTSVNDGISSFELPNNLVTNIHQFSVVDSARTLVIGWRSLQEINNKRFTLMKGLDRNNLFALHDIDGLVFDRSGRDFEVVDRNVKEGIWYYYQVQAEDDDGKIVSFKIDSAIIIIADGLTMYPNPSSGRIFMKLNRDVQGSGVVEVYNFVGQKVTTTYFDDLSVLHNNYSYSSENLTKGAYLFKLTTQSEEVFLHKIIIK